ncbi:hypothetical protein Mapa_013489 [Marchantia paleacea]|nr:hypothetical protein Mapa_013489 [Marchantia paleacea]
MPTGEGVEALWCPTIVTECTDETRAEVVSVVEQTYEQSVHGVAFTSQTGIKAFSDALQGRKLHGDSFFVAAMGRDGDYLNELNIIDQENFKVLNPATPTPSGLVEALGEGKGRRILCPVPLVVNLEEPPVVPEFLRDLTTRVWSPVRVNTYTTRWMGAECAKRLLSGGIDALVFTSSAEIEGHMKRLNSLGEEPSMWRDEKRRTFSVAAHGPVTAHGAHRLGVQVDVVGTKLSSFSGVVEQLSDRIALERRT